MTPEEANAAERHVLGDTRSRSIWRWQLMLAISVVAIAAVSALLTPEVFTEWRFLAALIGVIALTLVALSTRWEHASSYTILTIPLLDIVAIYFLDAGSNAPISFLWVIPIAWIATYSPTPILVGCLGLISGLMLFHFATDGVSPDEAINLIMQLIVLGFIGTTIAAGSSRNRSARRLLQAQTQRIETALQRVFNQRARTQRMLDSLDIGIARVGAEGILQFANRRFQELYSFEDADQFNLAPAVEYHSRRGAPAQWDETTVSRASRGELFANEIVWLFDIDGKWRALRASTRIIEDGHFANDGLLLLVEEVTEKLDPQASHGAAMRMISHELRNPLTAVIGHVDLLLERTELSGGARKLAEVIQHAGDRMEALIDHALSANGPTLDDEDVEFDLVETTARSVEGFAPSADANKIWMNLNFDEPLPVLGDVFRLRQVVDNVVGNAVKYSQRGGTISIRGFRQNEEHAVLEVSDTGIGISEQDLPHIFDPGFRASSARSSSVSGTGLGLGISRDITIACGGMLEVQSELGRGTTVTITIPTNAERSRE